MKINIVRSMNYDEEEFKEIEKILIPFSNISGLQFIFRTQPIIENVNGIMSWEYIFLCINNYRTVNKIPTNEFISYLTPYENIRNYFSALDPSFGRSTFIQTSDLDIYIRSNPIYPIAYQIVKQALSYLMLDSNQNPDDLLHHELRGCINDYCADKMQINFKMRTADICQDCLKIIKKRKINTKIIEQCTSIFESIRFEMLFSETNKNIFYSKIPQIQIGVLSELVTFLSKNLDSDETKIQKWLDEKNGMYRKQRCLIFGMEYIDPKREGQLSTSRRFDILAEQNCDNHVIIELKSPKANIFKITKKKNKNGGYTTDYSISPELARAIPQVLGYKTEYERLKPDEMQKLGLNEKKIVSECIIVIGKRVDDPLWKEHFNNLQKNVAVRILTYSDLIDKMENTIQNLKNML